MTILQRMRTFLDDLQERTFYVYVAVFLVSIVLTSTGILWYYYHAIHTITEEIALIDNQRLQVKRMLTTYEQVKKHRTEVDELIQEDPRFKISGYFNDALTKLGLTMHKGGIFTTSHVDHDKYAEAVLRAPLTDMNMRQLAELLNELEQNKRVYVKELDINKSKKNSKTIDVTLVLASLEPTSSNGA